MEIQQLDLDEELSVLISSPIPKPVLPDDTVASSSSRSGWRRLKNETICLPPNLAPFDTSAKITDVDEDLDDEIYEQIKSEFANLGLQLGDRSITNQEIDALSPLIQRIVDLVTPNDQDTRAQNNKKIDLLEQLANHSSVQDASQKLLQKDIQELRTANNTLVCGKGKTRKGLNKLGHKVAKFWKKHKKAILITAAIIAATATVVVIIVAGPTAAAGTAAASGAAGGAALSDDGNEDKSPSKPTPSPPPPTDVAFSYPFETFDPTAYPGKLTFGDSGVFSAGRYSYTNEILQNPSMTEKSWVNDWLHSAERFPDAPHIPSSSTSPSAKTPSHSDLLLCYQASGDYALSTGFYNQALQDFNNAIELEPSDPALYLGRGAAHFELGKYDDCLADYDQYQTHAPQKFSVTDFSIGFAKGLPRGIYDSGEGLLLFLSDLVRHPVQTGAQVYEALSTLSSLVKSGEWETVGKALSPEVHQLITQWDSLPDSKKGELAGYAFGKNGADILIPGAAAKLVAKGSIAVKELGAACKNLQSAEKVLVLEAVAEGSHAGIDVGKVITSAQRTLTEGEDLGLTTLQMAELKQAGELEQVVGKGRDYFAGNPELQASYDRIKNAQEGLKPYIKKPMPETEIRNLILQQGIPTFARPAGIPENFKVQLSKKGAGMEYVHPTNTATQVRVMPGKPHSPLPFQQKPYVNHRINGQSLDKHGNIVPNESPEAHIPLEEFIYRGLE